MAGQVIQTELDERIAERLQTALREPRLAIESLVHGQSVNEFGQISIFQPRERSDSVG